MFHPFYVKDESKETLGNWVAASNLKKGDELLTEDGKNIKVSEVRVQKLDEEITVYNLEITEVHTYYVAGGVLVHNACADAGGSRKNTGEGGSDYSNLKNSKSVGVGKRFTPAQKKNIIQQNMERNGGVIKSDISGEILVPATKSQKGVTPNPLEVQIDHIEPRSKGGTNSYSNAQVLSRYENIKKSDK